MRPLNLEKTLINSSPKDLKLNKNKSTIVRDAILSGMLFVGLAVEGIMGYTGYNPFVSKEPVSQKTPIKNSLTYDFKSLDNWKFYEEYPASLRDPFIDNNSINPQEIYSKKLLLKGIVFSDNKEGSALIGIELYHEGDEVEGKIIVEINERYIKIRDKNTGEISEKRVEQTID